MAATATMAAGSRPALPATSVTAHTNPPHHPTTRTYRPSHRKRAKSPTRMPSRPRDLILPPPSVRHPTDRRRGKRRPPRAVCSITTSCTHRRTARPHRRGMHRLPATRHRSRPPHRAWTALAGQFRRGWTKGMGHRIRVRRQFPYPAHSSASRRSNPRATVRTRQPTHLVVVVGPHRLHQAHIPGNFRFRPESRGRGRAVASRIPRMNRPMCGKAGNMPYRAR